MWMLIRVVCCLAPLGVIGYLAYDGDAPRPMMWNAVPSVANGLALASLLLAGVGLSLTLRPTGRCWGWIAFVAGLLVAVGGYAGCHYCGVAYSDLTNEQNFFTDPRANLKVGAAETIVGYYYLTPLDGGPVAVANGAVYHVSADEFRKAKKAEPPDFEPVWRSPNKTRPEPTPPPAGETEPQRMIRQASERTRMSSDLKQMITAHFYAGPKPPLDPDALAQAAKLDDRQRAALNDGTYVWYFGWTTRDLDAEAATKAKTDAVTRQTKQYMWFGWSSFLLAGLGLAGSVGGLLLLVRRPKA